MYTLVEPYIHTLNKHYLAWQGSDRYKFTYKTYHLIVFDAWSTFTWLLPVIPFVLCVSYLRYWLSSISYHPISTCGSPILVCTSPISVSCFSDIGLVKTNIGLTQIQREQCVSLRINRFKVNSQGIYTRLSTNNVWRMSRLKWIHVK